MADFPSRAVDGPPGSDRMRGDLISVVDSNTYRGTNDILPHIVWIECPTVQWRDHLNKAVGVIVDLQLEVLSDDDVGNSSDLRLYSTTDCSITRPIIPVTSYLSHWGVTDAVVVDR